MIPECVKLKKLEKLLKTCWELRTWKSINEQTFSMMAWHFLLLDQWAAHSGASILQELCSTPEQRVTPHSSPTSWLWFNLQWDLKELDEQRRTSSLKGCPTSWSACKAAWRAALQAHWLVGQLEGLPPQADQLVGQLEGLPYKLF
jgi:hypothetical protein